MSHTRDILKAILTGNTQTQLVRKEGKKVVYIRQNRDYFYDNIEKFKKNEILTMPSSNIKIKRATFKIKK